MSTATQPAALQVHRGAEALSAVGQWTTEQVAVIRESVAKLATEPEFRLFLAICGRTGLDPFTRQIHFVKYGNNPGTTVTGIDGYRLIAQRSLEYEGQTPPQWCGPDGAWVEVWLKSEPPAAARVGVWRKGFREPAWGVARMSAYKGTGPNWTKMSAEMLAKCAEALGLRKAFPNELSGLYTREEMEQAGPPKGMAEVIEEPAALAAPAERDWHVAFVDLCREHGMFGRGAKLLGANLVAAAAEWPVLVASPKAADPFWQRAVEWVEQHGWPPPVEDEPPPPDDGALAETLAASVNDVEATTYYSKSEGKRVPIAGMAMPHVLRAIQRMEAVRAGVLEPTEDDNRNSDATLVGLYEERDRQRGAGR